MVTALQAGATSALQAEQREDSTGPDGADDSPEEQAAAEVGVGRLEIAGAGLDVTEEEPLPTTSALWSLPNVVLTPHCAPHTASSTDSPRPEENGPFFELSLHLSRACLSKMFFFIYEWLKKTVFTHRG